MKKSNRPLSLLLALLAGASAFAVFAPMSAYAQTELITICFRNRTVQVPLYLLSRYQSVPNTTIGPCETSP